MSSPSDISEKSGAVKGDMQIVLFQLADVHYGVDVGQVQGVVDVQTITKVPNAPYYVEGITNLRGEVITVLDLRSSASPSGVRTRTLSWWSWAVEQVLSV